MSQRPKKRTKNQRASSSSEPQSTPIEKAPMNNNTLVGRGGKQGKNAFTILDGFYYNAEDLEGTNFWSLVEHQKWEKFMSSNNPIHPDLVHYFYEHVEITFNNVGDDIRFQIEFDDTSTFQYSNRDFMEDFGLKSRGYENYPDSYWPEGLFKFVDVTKDLNNNREFMPGEKKDNTIPRLELFNGDDKFATFGITRALLPSTSQDRKVSKVVAAFLYAFKNRIRINLPVLIGRHMCYAMNNKAVSSFPYGMLVTHIMKKWDIITLGPSMPSSSIHMIGVKSIKNQKLVMFRGRFWSRWEMLEASQEDRAELEKLVGKPFKIVGDDVEGNEVEGGDIVGDNVEVQGDEVEQDRQFDVRAELRHISERQDNLMQTQQKHGKYLKGMMKFLRCLGGAGASDAADRYLQHSDSDTDAVANG